MPLIRLTTNVRLDTEQKTSLLKGLSQHTAKCLAKSEQYVMAVIHDAAALTFAGTEDPAAYIELKSLNLPEDATSQLSTSLCSHIEEMFNIPPERIYIEFKSGERHLWGWNSKTF